MMKDLNIERLEIAAAFERTTAATVGLWFRALPALSEPGARELWAGRMRTAIATADAATRMPLSIDARLAWNDVCAALAKHGEEIARALREHGTIVTDGVEVAA